MDQKQDQKRELTARQKWTIAGATGLFAAIGALLGVIAYYQQWLG